MPKSSRLSAVFLFLILGLGYIYFAHFLERESFYLLIVIYTFLFLGSIGLYFIASKNTKLLLGVALIFRLLFLFSIPGLSQDFYRFIWDGRILTEGMNPYITKPLDFINAGDLGVVNQAQALFDGMGMLNASHFTNYPPLNQFFFWLAAVFSPKSILGAAIVLRISIILADLGIFFVGRAILKKMKLPTNRIFLFLLNPFIIIELTGNLHFESLMLFFLLLSIWFLLKGFVYRAAMGLSASVLIKLIPLIFIPLFFRYLGFRKWLQFSLTFTVFTLFAFTPFISKELVINYTDSVGLWFRSFEFNASFYYILRTLGYWFRGWNEIAIIGEIIPVFVIFFIGFLSLKKGNQNLSKLLVSMLFGISFYYFTTTTMHPWYLATPLVLCVLTPFRFPILWSFTIILSYFAYRVKGEFFENNGILMLEYLPVYALLFWELRMNFKKNSLL